MIAAFCERVNGKFRHSSLDRKDHHPGSTGLSEHVAHEVHRSSSGASWAARVTQASRTRGKVCPFT